MEEQHHTDDQSHYEISLTAGQAFIAFVLLLLSLAASFGFGLMIGKGQADERLVVRKETPVVTEGAMIPSKKESEGKIVELPAVADDEQEPATETAAPTDTATPAPAIIEEATATAATETAAVTEPAAPATPMFAQLLSTSDQRVAEVLAARVIEKGFNSAYVERGSTDKGPVYRVRIKFPSEADARAAEPKLKEFAKEVWITSK